MAIVWIVLTACVLMASKHLCRSFVSPLSIYCGVWFLGLALLDFRWVANNELMNSTYWLIFASLAVFVWGAITTTFLWNKRAPVRTPIAVVAEEHTQAYLAKVVWFFFWLSIAGFLGFFVAVQSTLGWGVALRSPSMLDQLILNGNVPYLSITGRLMFLSSINVAIIMYLLARKGSLSWPVVVVLLLEIFMNLSTRRQNLIGMCVWAAFSYLYAGGKFRFRTIITGALAVSGILAYFTVIQVALKKTAVSVSSQYVLVNMPSWLVDPYLYIVGNFPALQSLIRQGGEHTYGAVTLNLVYLALGKMFPSIPRPDLSIEFQQIPYSFNTAPYLWDYYRDFGLIGILVVPFLLGVFHTHLFHKMKHSPTFIRVYFNSLFSVALFFSIRENRYIWYDTWFSILVGGVLVLMLARPQLGKERPKVRVG